MRYTNENETGRQVIAFLRYSLFFLGTVLYVGGLLTRGYGLMVIGVVVFFAGNLFFGFAEGKTRFVFLFFHLSIFTFLISRPLIQYLTGVRLWYKWYTTNATVAAFNMLFLSMLALRLGAVIGDGILHRLEGKAPLPKENPSYRQAFIKNLALISFIFFLITIAASFAEGIDKLFYMKGKVYTEFYLGYETNLPSFVIMMASMAKYAMCIFLATLPKKRSACFVLILFLLDSVPSFLIGMRNPLILRLIFVICYFLVRDAANDPQKWIGKFEKAVILIATPAGIAFLGIYGLTRTNQRVKGGFFSAVVDFFYNQGTSFDTVRAVTRILPQLPNSAGKNYTFASFIDYIVYGSIGQRLFHTPDIGSTNSVTKAVYGNDLAHSAMYVLNKSAYLKGHGKGSSYILENYADWGYPGVFIFSLILGIVLILLVYFMKQENTLVRTIAYVSLIGLFFTPRSGATEWISFIVFIQFWLLIIAVYLIAGLCVKGYTLKKTVNTSSLKKNLLFDGGK